MHTCTCSLTTRTFIYSPSHTRSIAQCISRHLCFPQWPCCCFWSGSPERRSASGAISMYFSQFHISNSMHIKPFWFLLFLSRKRWTILFPLANSLLGDHHQRLYNVRGLPVALPMTLPGLFPGLPPRPLPTALFWWQRRVKAFWGLFFLKCLTPQLVVPGRYLFSRDWRAFQSEKSMLQADRESWRAAVPGRGWLAVVPAKPRSGATTVWRCLCPSVDPPIRGRLAPCSYTPCSYIPGSVPLYWRLAWCPGFFQNHPCLYTVLYLGIFWIPWYFQRSNIWLGLVR